MPMRMCTSIVLSNLAYATCLSTATASSTEYSLAGSTSLAAARYFFPCFFIDSPSWSQRAFALPRPDLLRDVHTHTARRAFDQPHGGFDRPGVQILHLGLRNIAQLLLIQFAHFVLIGSAGAFFRADCFLDHIADRRRLRHEGERAVRKYSYFD